MNRSVASLQPYTRQVLNGAVIAATGGSATFQIPNDLAEFRIIVQVTAVAGTTPTLDASLQDSPDGGTTFFYTGNKLAQIVAVGSRQISLSRERAAAQAAAEFVGDVPAIGAAAAAANGPISRNCRLWFAVGGTAGPSFTVNVWIIGNPANA